MVRCLLLLAGFSLPLGAAVADDLDVTMRMVIDDAELTDSVVREIELPMVNAPQLRQGKPEAASGLDAAQDVRTSGREFGQAVAEEARNTKRRSEIVPEKPDLPARPEQPAKPERPELPSAVKDHVDTIRDKTPPGLDR